MLLAQQKTYSISHPENVLIVQRFYFKHDFQKRKPKVLKRENNERTHALKMQ